MSDKDKEQQARREKAAAAWERAKKDIERHDREFNEKHGGQ